MNLNIELQLGFPSVRSDGLGKPSVYSFATNNLDVEDEVRVGRDAGLGTGAISGRGGATEIGLLTNGHLSHSGLPALDHGHLTDSERDGLATGNGRVENLTVGGKSAGVLNLGSLAGLALSAGTLGKNVNRDS